MFDTPVIDIGALKDKMLNYIFIKQFQFFFQILENIVNERKHAKEVGTVSEPLIILTALFTIDLKFLDDNNAGIQRFHRNNKRGRFRSLERNQWNKSCRFR